MPNTTFVAQCFAEDNLRTYFPPFHRFRRFLECRCLTVRQAANLHRRSRHDHRCSCACDGSCVVWLCRSVLIHPLPAVHHLEDVPAVVLSVLPAIPSPILRTRKSKSHFTSSQFRPAPFRCYPRIHIDADLPRNPAPIPNDAIVHSSVCVVRLVSVLVVGQALLVAFACHHGLSHLDVWHAWSSHSREFLWTVGCRGRKGGPELRKGFLARVMAVSQSRHSDESQSCWHRLPHRSRILTSRAGRSLDEQRPLQPTRDELGPMSTSAEFDPSLAQVEPGLHFWPDRVRLRSKRDQARSKRG